MISSIQHIIGPHLSLEHKVNCVNVQRRAIKRTCRLAMLKMYLVANLILMLTPTYSVASHDPWGENLQPKLHTDYLNEYSDSADHFLGNSTHVDYFKLLRKDGSSLLIGARNVIYNLSLPDLKENIEQVR